MIEYKDFVWFDCWRKSFTKDSFCFHFGETQSAKTEGGKATFNAF